MAKTRRALRNQGFRLEPLEVVSLRLHPEIIERCGWAAKAKGWTRTEFIRHTLADATRDAKPPNGREFRGLAASSEEWAAWSWVAEQRGEPIEDTMRTLLNRAVAIYEAKKEAAAS